MKTKYMILKSILFIIITVGAGVAAVAGYNWLTDGGTTSPWI